MRGSPSAAASAHSFSVCTSTPATASTTTTAASTTRSAERASVRKLAKPGVSMKLILVFLPFGVGEAGGERVLAGDLFVVEVGDGGAVVDPADAIDGAGGEEQGRHQLRLAASAVSDDSHVADGWPRRRPS